MAVKDNQPVERCLSLGCGSGHLERSLARQNVFLECDAYDISPTSLEIARQFALEQGFHNITYYQADLNTLQLLPNSYGLVIANRSLHHLWNLEGVFEQIQLTLIEGGLFIFDEYVGPNRFQLPERQKDVINLALRLLPEKYRRIYQTKSNPFPITNPNRNLRWLAAKFRSGQVLNLFKLRWRHWLNRGSRETLVLESVRFATEYDVTSVDPSEAIRSSEILDLAPKYFKIVDLRKLGGDIFQFLLSSDITWNFMNDPYADALLKMIFEIEEGLIEFGELKSDFVCAAGRPLQAASAG